MSGVTGEIGFKIGAAGAKLPGVNRPFTGQNNTALTVNGVPGTFALAITGAAQPDGAPGTGAGIVSNGLLVRAGNGSTDVVALIEGGGNGSPGTSTFLNLTANGLNWIGWNVSGTSVINWNNQGAVSFAAANIAVLSANNLTTYLNMGAGGIKVGNIAGGTPPVVIYAQGGTNTVQLSIGVTGGLGTAQGVVLGTSSLYAISTGTPYPVLQFAGIGAITGTGTIGLNIMAGGLYYNGTNYIYGQAGTGIVASLGTGTFSISAFNTSGTAAGTATPFVVMSVSGSATQGIVNLGTGTTLPWGGGAAFSPVLQCGVTGGIVTVGAANQGMIFLSGCYYNGTNYQFTGTGGGGTTTAGVLQYVGGKLSGYFGGVGTYTQGATLTQNFAVNGTVGPVIQAYGPNAATLVDMTPDTGTFTGTWGGFITAPTNTAAYWSRQGNQVMLLIPYGTGSKAGAAGNITFAMPAASSGGPPLPVKTQLGMLPVCINGATTSVGNVIVSSANATLTLQGLGGIAFSGTANASIGVTGDFTCIPYAIGP